MAELNGVNGTTCDAEQYQQFVSSRDSPNTSISCLTRRENIGLVVGISLVFPCAELIPQIAGCRNINPQFRLCGHHIHLDLLECTMVQEEFSEGWLDVV